MRSAAAAWLLVSVLSPMLTHAQAPFNVKRGAGDSNSGRVQKAIEEIDKIATKAGSGEDAVDEVFARSQGAIKRLGKAGAEAIPQIEAALGNSSKDWKARAMFCEALGQINDDKSVSALSRILADASQPEFVRAVAGHSIAAMDRRDTESLIKKTVDDKSVPIKVRARIMMAVGQRGLDDIDWLKSLARGTSPSLPPDRHAEISQAEFGMILNAQRALGASKNPRAFDALLELAERSPANANFIEQLGEKDDPRAIPVLIKALMAKPTTSTARDHAANALGKLKAREAVGPFIEIIKSDPDPLLVEKVAIAAVAIGDKRVAPALRELVANLKTDPRFSQSAHPAFWNQEPHGWGPIFTIKKALADLEK